MRDAALVERLMLSELTQREATEAEARRVATEAVVAQAWRRQVCEQIDESRRLVAVELFVLRAATALNEVAAIARLRRATLTIGIAAASQLLEQTLLLEAARAECSGTTAQACGGRQVAYTWACYCERMFHAMSTSSFKQQSNVTGRPCARLHTRRATFSDGS